MSEPSQQAAIEKLKSLIDPPHITVRHLQQLNVLFDSTSSEQEITIKSSALQKFCEDFVTNVFVHYCRESKVYIPLVSSFAQNVHQQNLTLKSKGLLGICGNWVKSFFVKPNQQNLVIIHGTNINNLSVLCMVSDKVNNEHVKFRTEIYQLTCHCKNLHRVNKEKLRQVIREIEESGTTRSDRTMMLFGKRNKIFDD